MRRTLLALLVLFACCALLAQAVEFSEEHDISDCNEDAIEETELLMLEKKHIFKVCTLRSADNWSLCPAKWLYRGYKSRAGITVLCQAPENYKGPCGKLWDLTDYDSLSRETFMYTCNVEWPKEAPVIEFNEMKNYKVPRPARNLKTSCVEKSEDVPTAAPTHAPALNKNTGAPASRALVKNLMRGSTAKTTAKATAAVKPAAQKVAFKKPAVAHKPVATLKPSARPTANAVKAIITPKPAVANKPVGTLKPSASPTAHAVKAIFTPKPAVAHKPKPSARPTAHAVKAIFTPKPAVAHKPVGTLKPSASPTAHAVANKPVATLKPSASPTAHAVKAIITPAPTQPAKH